MYMTGYRGGDDDYYGRRRQGRNRYHGRDRYGRGGMQLNNNMYMKGDDIKDDGSGMIDM